MHALSRRKILGFKELLKSCAFVTEEDTVFEILLNADTVYLFPKVNMQNVLFKNNKGKKTAVVL